MGVQSLDADIDGLPDLAIFDHARGGPGIDLVAKRRQDARMTVGPRWMDRQLAWPRIIRGAVVSADGEQQFSVGVGIVGVCVLVWFVCFPGVGVSRVG
jgi:hypothetical protein